MLSNLNDITPSNYEEYFILYIDNELDAAERSLVESFLSLHPHLAEELEMLMTTKLPADSVSFYNKEELLSSSMKLNVVDEQLLLYVDNEASSTQKISVEEKINSDKDYALQYSLLRQTKVDAAEVVVHPNKKELYRHTERVVYFPVWMRIAAAIIIFLFGSVVFLVNSNKEAADTAVVTNKPSSNPLTKDNSSTGQKTIPIPVQKEQPVLVKIPAAKKNPLPVPERTSVKYKLAKKASNDIALQQNITKESTKREVTKLHVARLFAETNINELSVNKTIAYTPVTSPVTASYNNQNDPLEPAVTDGDFEMEKKTRGKGFFRKVSRFIQRNTGIGTVNSDNELLIGAVALKLK
jgi:hypothetical protein